MTTEDGKHKLVGCVDLGKNHDLMKDLSGIILNILKQYRGIACACELTNLYFSQAVNVDDLDMVYRYTILT